MKVNEMFPSRYLIGSDLAGHTVQVTIAKVAQESMHDRQKGEVKKFVVYFDGKKKGLVLNVTLAKQIAVAVGDDDTDHWAGHQITIFPETLNIAGEEKLTIHAKASPSSGADHP